RTGQAKGLLWLAEIPAPTDLSRSAIKKQREKKRKPITHPGELQARPYRGKSETSCQPQSGNENQQRGNRPERPKGCVQALLSQRSARQPNRRLAGDCPARRHPRLSRGDWLHQPRRFLRADVCN